MYPSAYVRTSRGISPNSLEASRGSACQIAIRSPITSLLAHAPWSGTASLRDPLKVKPVPNPESTRSRFDFQIVDRLLADTRCFGGHRIGRLNPGELAVFG